MNENPPKINRHSSTFGLRRMIPGPVLRHIIHLFQTLHVRLKAPVLLLTICQAQKLEKKEECL